MLPPAQRLRRTNDIHQVYKTGRPSFHAWLRVLAAPNQADGPRATVVVSTRVSKKAVDRNRLKRQLRAQLQQEMKHITQAIDIVVVAQPKALTAEATALRLALTSSLKKLHLL